MQHITVKGLVIRETPFGESDSYITVLTETGSKIEVLCRGVRRRGGRLSNAVRLFCHSELTLYESRGRYTLNDADLLHNFWGISQDFAAYALACYFAELAGQLGEGAEDCPAVTRLFLCALHAMSEQKRPLPVVKAAFELRLLAETGFAPELTACGACEKTFAADEPVFFSVREGRAVCLDCAKRLGGDFTKLGAGTLQAMRFILSADIGRVFAFSLGEAFLNQLSRLCEAYAIYHIGRTFESLELYHSVQALPS